ncbi:alpha/beta hydrolase [Bacillus pseudomycoides]|uniref:Alpha/beta hydrolase n=1 Tax=Bacillus pseudomycoides TaxID=64104 RepID=A0A2C3VRG8_9BACI|nr:alpha/beta hydrolase [Bacillus pseudomycoides]PDY47901.1 alpha/beta hydrolase [Bacillus pseudomycoides]PEA81388.1 alpha/beta hydrolase [Bacillus pseudomycoides]PED73194.1 alpha/beta hydrolase [Bacillus pseudomycoides]PEJ80738.1 alpha/beta hydrolase [Bacillus pseudomycoides]PEM16006.1 alpha/beta hydrolase [Bacillus pseudomycoides]
MKGNKKEIQTNDKVIRYTHIETGSKTICFMFSGSGYNYDKPLFYYSTMVMLQNKIDIVHIHYSYDERIMKKTIEEITKIMIDDITPVVLDVLKNGQYTNSIFLGKSLGTIPIANDLMKRDEFLKSKMILFTPLINFDSIFDSILNSHHQGLLVIGDKDHYYNVNQIDQLSKSNVTIDIIQNANHSLNVGEFETTNSILAVSRVMEKLQETVRTN